MAVDKRAAPREFRVSFPIAWFPFLASHLQNCRTSLEIVQEAGGIFPTSDPFFTLLRGICCWLLEATVFLPLYQRWIEVSAAVALVLAGMAVGAFGMAAPAAESSDVASGTFAAANSQSEDNS